MLFCLHWLGIGNHHPEDLVSFLFLNRDLCHSSVSFLALLFPLATGIQKCFRCSEAIPLNFLFSGLFYCVFLFRSFGFCHAVWALGITVWPDKRLCMSNQLYEVVEFSMNR